MRTWEKTFQQTFGSMLNLAEAMNCNPEALEMDFLDKQVKAGKVAPRVCSDEEYKTMMRETLNQWQSGRRQSQEKTAEAPTQDA